MLRQDRACLHHLLCIFTKLIKQNCTHLQAIICMHFFRFFWQEYAVLQRKKRNKGVQRNACRHISLDYSYPYILQVPIGKSTKKRRNYGVFLNLYKTWTKQQTCSKEKCKFTQKVKVSFSRAVLATLSTL